MTTTYQQVYTDRKPTDAKYMPGDIKEVYSMMSYIKDDLTDSMKDDVREWREALQDTMKEWRANTNDDGMEPDWDVYRQWMNDITDDDGSPQLLFIA